MSGGTGALVEQILVEVAETADVSKSALPPLYESIDAECLQGLVVHADDKPTAEVTIQFAYAGYSVTVSGSQSVSVEY